MATFTHWKKLVNPDYIGAYALPKGEDLTLTIANVAREMVTGTGGKKEECTVIHWTEKNVKPFILNKTNAKTIQKIYGTPYIEEWEGKRITLYAASTRLAGEEVECLRIRPTAPTLPQVAPGTPLYDNVLKALKAGYTFAQIEKKYALSTDVRNKLNKDLSNE
jgi:hypothetical protein